MSDKHAVAPEHTAVRVSLWRALHAQIDAEPHILEDVVGLELIADEGWRSRPDMDPQGTRRIRASIVARARFIEDLVEEQLRKGVGQYVILGAGLDTFAERRQDIAPRLRIFEVDQPGPQAWKKQRLEQTGFGIPEWVKFVPVDFEAGQSWWDEIVAGGFDAARPAVVVSTGVTMYLTKEANINTLKQMAKLARGSTFATTFMYPVELLEQEDRPTMEFTLKAARQSGTPFISLFAPADMLALANEAGLMASSHVSPLQLRERYFAGRADGLCSASAEAFLVAKI